jgi:hypothetical protein
MVHASHLHYDHALTAAPLLLVRALLSCYDVNSVLSACADHAGYIIAATSSRCPLRLRSTRVFMIGTKCREVQHRAHTLRLL